MLRVIDSRPDLERRQLFLRIFDALQPKAVDADRKAAAFIISALLWETTRVDSMRDIVEELSWRAIGPLLSDRRPPVDDGSLYVYDYTGVDLDNPNCTTMPVARRISREEAEAMKQLSNDAPPDAEHSAQNRTENRSRS
ncbi:MAG: hypothetical protein ACT4TC_07605 [Myxococcaceae bacterium]